jgi:hypothetical protein
VRLTTYAHVNSYAQCLFGWVSNLPQLSITFTATQIAALLQTSVHHLRTFTYSFQLLGLRVYLSTLQENISFLSFGTKRYFSDQSSLNQQALAQANNGPDLEHPAGQLEVSNQALVRMQVNVGRWTSFCTSGYELPTFQLSKLYEGGRLQLTANLAVPKLNIH